MLRGSPVGDLNIPTWHIGNTDEILTHPPLRVNNFLMGKKGELLISVFS